MIKAPADQEIDVIDRLFRRSLADALNRLLRAIAVVDAVMAPLENLLHLAAEVFQSGLPGLANSSVGSEPNIRSRHVHEN